MGAWRARGSESCGRHALRCDHRWQMEVVSMQAMPALDEVAAGSRKKTKKNFPLPSALDAQVKWKAKEDGI